MFTYMDFEEQYWLHVREIEREGERTKSKTKLKMVKERK